FLIQVKDDLQPGFRKEMTKAISELDWLDRDRLQSSLLKILLQAETKGSNSFQRPVGFRLSPNQRQLLEDLTTALIDEELQLDKNHPDSSENVLRLYAALANRSPRWASDAWVSSLIKRLLSAWKVMRHSENPYDALSLIYEERLENAVKTFPDDFRPDAADAIKFLTGAGESGLELMEMLIKNSTGEGQPAMVSNYQSSSNRLPRFHSKDSLIGHSKKHTVSGDDGILHGTDQENDIGNMLETACAGVFLLLRSIQDIRLPMIVRDADFPRLKEKIPGACEPMQPLSVIMLSLAHLWTGRSSLADNKFDPGLTLFAGFDTPPSLGDLHKIWSRVSNKDCDRFQQFLLSTLAGLRFLRGSWVHLYQIPMNQKTALICGDAVGRLWPLGRIIHEKPEAKKIVSQWRHMWKTTTGRKLKLVSSDKILEDLVDLYIEDEKACNGLLGTEMSDCTENQKDLEVDYKDSREALVAALKVLNNKSFEIADVDLTMALTAIAILRVWARWLKQFSGSSVAYLLTNFIRRPGRIYNGESSILVEMDSKPVDIVLEMTGYTAKMDRLSWFGNRDVSYEIHSI
ncbi:MAG: hypothetical protein PVG96_19795, partial [Desulfobacterales bacterium]